MKRRRSILTMKWRKYLTGFMFVSPFVVGFICFFMYPFVQSIIFSFNQLELTPTGYVLHYVGLDNYHNLLFVHPSFRIAFTETLVQMLSRVPAVLIFSFFAANMLNQRFRGRTIARVVFFLPVIMGAQAVLALQSQDYMQKAMSYSKIGAELGMFSGSELRNYLMQLQLPDGLLAYVFGAADSVPQIINSSGIPILIMLAALQSIPSSVFEAASIEGATKWECFWKITFPMILPMIMASVVYTIVESFTSPYNKLVNLIKSTAWQGQGFGVSAAMSWFYFITIAIVLAAVMGVMAKSSHSRS
ncbi:MAG TPA: sugar ABC transporter permease [Limnochordia bacterium]|jgi:ABC-type sugar transport system permease subunit|nr:sugar ABC transporter permease [Limnochordia bacterium]HPT93700.1 sugar ABC transporter permease [Limnochordia bacterium]HPZ31834.1 sugar ABC transporter permease [Limnochordia bacterium]HXK96406.1 sugar ABC transporter permease [Limnochordia bacterium]